MLLEALTIHREGFGRPHWFFDRPIDKPSIKDVQRARFAELPLGGDRKECTQEQCFDERFGRDADATSAAVGLVKIMNQEALLSGLLGMNCGGDDK